MPMPPDWADRSSPALSAANLNALSVGLEGLGANVRAYGALGDGTTDDSTAIQAAIDDVSSAGDTGLVVFPGGNYRIGTTINLAGGVKLIGSGAYDAASQPGSQLKALGTLSGPVLKYTAPSPGVLWHHGGIERLRVRDAPAGHGIHILGGLGEGNVFDRVLVSGCSGDGFRIEGASTPLHLGRIAPHSNGGAGVRLVSQTETHVQIQYIGGDNNGESLLTIDSLDTTSSIDIMGWKAERYGASAGHPDVFVINNGNGALINLGQGRVHIGSGAALSTGAIVRQATTGLSTVGRISITPTLHTDTGTSYTDGYRDDSSSTTCSIADVIRGLSFIGQPPRFLTPSTDSAALLIGPSASGIGLYYSDFGTPENVITAGPGSYCFATNGSVYKKYTGSGATGWRNQLGVDFFGAKGSLIAGAGATQGGNFSVGTDRTTLVADSSQTFGLRWDPTGGRNFTTGGRPSAAAVPTGTQIYNTTTSIPNFSDGTNWRDAAGTIV